MGSPPLRGVESGAGWPGRGGRGVEVVERRRTLRGRRSGREVGNGIVGKAVDGARMARVPGRRGITNGRNRTAPLHPYGPAPGDTGFRCGPGKVKLAAAGSSKRR